MGSNWVEASHLGQTLLCQELIREMQRDEEERREEEDSEVADEPGLRSFMLDILDP